MNKKVSELLPEELEQIKTIFALAETKRQIASAEAQATPTMVNPGNMSVSPTVAATINRSMPAGKSVTPSGPAEVSRPGMVKQNIAPAPVAPSSVAPSSVAPSSQAPAEVSTQNNAVTEPEFSVVPTPEEYKKAGDAQVKSVLDAGENEASSVLAEKRSELEANLKGNEAGQKYLAGITQPTQEQDTVKDVRKSLFVFMDELEKRASLFAQMYKEKTGNGLSGDLANLIISKQLMLTVERAKLDELKNNNGVGIAAADRVGQYTLQITVRKEDRRKRHYCQLQQQDC